MVKVQNLNYKTGDPKFKQPCRRVLDFFGFFLNAWAPGNRISHSIFCYFEVLGHYKMNAKTGQEIS